MKSSKVKKVARILEFKTEAETAYNLTDGLLFSIFETGGIICMGIDCYLENVSEDTRAAIKSFISEETGRYAISAYSVSSTGIRIEFQNTPTTGANVVDFYYCAESYLKKMGLRSDAVCSNCGDALNMGLIVSVDGFAHSCDAACASRLIGGISRGAVKYKTNFAAGLFGAFLFSLLSCGLWVYLSTIDFFPPASAAVVALAALLGYKLFGGKPCVGRFFAVTLFPLIFCTAANFITHLLAVSGSFSSDGFVSNYRELTILVYTELAKLGDFFNAFMLQLAAAAAIILFIGLAFFKKRRPVSDRAAVTILEGELSSDAASPEPKGEA